MFSYVLPLKCTAFQISFREVMLKSEEKIVLDTKVLSKIDYLKTFHKILFFGSPTLKLSLRVSKLSPITRNTMLDLKRQTKILKRNDLKVELCVLLST